jgi:cysteine desulfurase family protein
MIYLDNAATSFPKPQETFQHLTNFVEKIGGNPGRSGHTLSVEAARIIFEAREMLTDFIGGKDSERLIFTQNGTEALNLAILGFLHEGDHVITTSLEHNSVMRPLTFLRQERKVELSVAQCSPRGDLDPGDVKKLLKRNTKAVIINHGSNVIGAIQPVKEIRKTIGDVVLIVDACQTIGSVPVNLRIDGIDILCFSGHKSLYGIQGVGGLYLGEGIVLRPLKFGGTGSKSESLEHPDFLPDKYESGTPNTPGISSLLGGLRFIEKVGLDAIVKRKFHIRKAMIEGLRMIEGVTLYGPSDDDALPVIAMTIKGQLPSETGYELNTREIFTRVGLQCAPLAHQAIGTFPSGTVRVSPGYFTTDEDISAFLEAVREIAEKQTS